MPPLLTKLNGKMNTGRSNGDTVGLEQGQPMAIAPGAENKRLANDQSNGTQLPAEEVPQAVHTFSADTINASVRDETTKPPSYDVIPEGLLKQRLKSQPMIEQVPNSPRSGHSLHSLKGESSKLLKPENEVIEDIEESIAFSEENEVDAPIDYTTFHERHIADIAKQLSLVLEDICERNDKTPFCTEKLTRFHSRAPPRISIHDYLLRIIKFCNLEKAVLLVILFLVDLFTQCYSTFVLNSLTVHRFLITGCTVAAKGLCDLFCSNMHYAKVGGLTVMELNLLEVEFLTRVSYRIVPPLTVLGHYDRQLLSKKIESVMTQKSVTIDTGNSDVPAGPTEVPAVPADEGGRGRSLYRAETRKHPREVSRSTGSRSGSEPPDTHSQPKPSGKASGNKGVKAMKDSFKFLHHSKKKIPPAN